MIKILKVFIFQASKGPLFFIHPGRYLALKSRLVRICILLFISAKIRLAIIIYPCKQGQYSAQKYVNCKNVPFVGRTVVFIRHCGEYSAL